VNAIAATALSLADDRSIDDAVLASRAGTGDPAAFALLMRRYNRRLFRVARSLLRDTAEAEDALQEAYLSAYRAIGSFRGEASLATWLTRVVTNECTARLRRHARRDNIVPMVSVQDLQAPEEMPMSVDAHAPDPARPEHAFERAELRALLERRIDALPEVFRTVFMLRCVEELSVEETAACLGVPEATVRTRLFRARSLLRESLAQDIDLAERDVFAFDGERCDRMVAGVLGRLGDGS
jgi:RNA polymerase sigma-70 factor (ECF subfamily)